MRINVLIMKGVEMSTTIISSNADILELISCPKNFVSAPRKPALINRNSTQTFSVIGEKNELKFDIFITFSARMPQDFSLGLMHDGFLLLRCNGFHGTTKAGFYNHSHHAHPHAHVLTIADIENGRGKKPSFIEDLTGKYVNLDTAKVYFFDRCSILEYEKYFDVNQMTLY